MRKSGHDAPDECDGPQERPTVIDAHTHLSPISPEGAELRAESMIEKMNASGVDAIISMGSGGDTFEALKRNNDFNLQSAVDYANRIIPLVYFDPRYEEDGIGEIDRCIAKGRFKGIKVGHQFAEARYMYPMMEKAQEYKLPVAIHSDHSVRNHPYIIADLASSFPKVPVVILHMGGRTSAAVEMVAIKAAEKNQNVWLETCFSNPYPIRIAVQRLGADRIMFGSDTSNSGFGYGSGYEREEYEMMIHMESIRCLRLPKEEEAKIMGVNAMRLFSLEVGR